jgi:hypothetical protein
MRVFSLLGIATSVASLMIGSALGAGRDSSYFCAEDFVGGLSYDVSQKKWGTAKFRPEAKFVLRLKYIRSWIKDDENVDDYNVIITHLGSTYNAECLDFSQSQHEVVSDRKYTNLRCRANESDYIFNLKNSRFLSVYPVGYVEGEDNNDNTPHVSGGTCTKMD